MPPLDKKKEELKEYQTLRNYAITSLLALLAFIFTQFEKANSWILVLSGFALFGLGIIILLLQIKIKKKINEIGEL